MAGPAFILQFSITHWYWMFDGYNLEILEEYFKSCWPILTCKFEYNASKITLVLEIGCWDSDTGLGTPLDWALNQQKV